MALRQRLPRLGARLLSGLAAEAEAGAAAASHRAGSLQCARTFTRLAGPRCLRQLASTSAVSALAARQAPPSALLSLASLRQFAAAADLPAFQDLPMPALSPTMSQGNIVAWKKKEGDQVAPGDILCEVETDKATIEWEAQEEGFLAKILMPEGSRDIPVGTTVALLVEEAGDVAAFESYSPGAAAAAPKKAAAPKEEAPAAAAAAGAPGSFPAHQVLAMPSLSPTMNAGNILGWRKAVGDEVAAGDILAEVETDKATIEWESQDDGFIAQILVPEGTSGISVGTPVLVITESKEDVPAFAAFTAADAGAPGSGPGGRIVAADVQQLIASGGAAPAAAVGGAAPEAAYAYAAYTDIPNSQIRKVTARRLLESKQQVPHYYLTVSARVDRLQQLRQQLNASLAASGGGKLSLNDFVVKASALALRKVPEVNASWFPDFIRQYHTVDCSVAVQTPIGLMVPIVRDADLKGLAAIAGEVKELAGRAKEGRLRPEEFTGGTFTISNLGMFGVQQFAAIVNPPQAAILAVGTTEARVVPSATSPSGFEEANFLTCTLSCDHRVVDGAVGAQWLQAFKSYIEDPATMLL